MIDVEFCNIENCNERVFNMWRKLIIAIFFFTTVLSSIPIYSDSVTDSIGYINCSYIALLKQPDYSSDIIAKLSLNQKVEITEERGKWYKISAEVDDNQLNGWVESYFVNKQLKAYVVINTDNVNIRQGASTNFGVMGQVDKDTKLEYVRTYHSWYQVKYKDSYGYVAGWLGDIVSSEGQSIYFLYDNVRIRNKATVQDSSIIGVGEMNKAYTFLGKENGWVKIRLSSGKVGYVAGWLVTFENNFTSNLELLNRKRVIGSRLRLREGNSTNDRILELIEYGNLVRVLESNGDWDKVISPSGRIGYVHNSYLEDVKSLEGKVILLDPGHGGKDIGATPYSNREGLTDYYEKDYNLALSNQLKNELEKLGAKVVMTRTSDVYISPEDRALTSNMIKPDIFLSIHHNSITDDRYFGTSTYYNTSENASGIVGKKLALSIYRNVSSMEGIEYNGVWDRTFKVLRMQDQVAALIEVGFISNKYEEVNITLPSFTERLVTQITKGIEDYFYN